MKIGIAYDLRTAHAPSANSPDDQLEELDSEGTIAALASAIKVLGHEPRRLEGGATFLKRVLEDPPELVLNIAEGFGTRSREAHVPAVLEMLRIPFTHSDPLTLAVALDKGVCKRLVASAKIPTPRFAIITRRSEAGALALTFPVIAKPINEGSSIGIRNSSRITDARALAVHLERLTRDYEQPVLVEEFCPGPELTVGITGTGAEARVIGVMEISPRNTPLETFVYSLETKRNWQRDVCYSVPPRRDAAMLERATRLALDAYRALDCRDIGRVDLRLDAKGEPMFIELNPLPGLDPVKSDIVILARGMGWSYERLVGEIIASARKRHGL